MNIREYLAEAWKGYAQLTPDAPKIEALMRGRGEAPINDHLAFRTFNLPGIRRGDVGAIFEKWGYVKSDDELDFPEKKLKASYWLHEDATLPKIFVSELELERVSPALASWIRSFAEPAAAKLKGKLSAEDLLKPTWAPVKLEDYEKFYPESEYAAWTAAFGLRTNHFTVLVNSLKTFPSLQELNAFLGAQGFTLNDAGGVVKGTPKELLEQSSTMAKRIDWEFAGGARKAVMGCYYEFARRYPMAGTDRLFPGFIPKSADKIFESTFEKKK